MILLALVVGVIGGTHGIGINLGARAQKYVSQNWITGILGVIITYRALRYILQYSWLKSKVTIPAFLLPLKYSANADCLSGHDLGITPVPDRSRYEISHATDRFGQLHPRTLLWERLPGPIYSGPRWVEIRVT